MFWEILQVEAKHLKTIFSEQQVVFSLALKRIMKRSSDMKIKFYSEALISFSYLVMSKTFINSGHLNSTKFWPLKESTYMHMHWKFNLRKNLKFIFFKEDLRAFQSLIVIESDVKCCTLSSRPSIQ